MDYFKKILKESIIIVVITSCIGMLSGSLLSFNEEILYSIPIILLILPSLNSLIGDVSTVLISRLTTQLFIGTIPPKIQISRRLKDNVFGLLVTILSSLTLLLILGYGIGISTGIKIVNPILIILIIFVTVLVLFGIMFIFLFVSSIILFKRGNDPNNFLIPFMTTLLDFLMPLFLIVFIQILI